MPQEKATVLCPACNTRMSIRQQISYVKPLDTDEFVYHCPMCYTEIKERGPHLSKAPLASAVSA
jgi:hypothetical protein